MATCSPSQHRSPDEARRAARARLAWPRTPCGAVSSRAGVDGSSPSLGVAGRTRRDELPVEDAAVLASRRGDGGWRRAQSLAPWLPASFSLIGGGDSHQRHEMAPTAGLESATRRLTAAGGFAEKRSDVLHVRDARVMVVGKGWAKPPGNRVLGHVRKAPLSCPARSSRDGTSRARQLEHPRLPLMA